jgi:hypothetical protein
MKDLLKFIAAAFIVFVFVIYGAFSWGYVTTIIADWYILPIFPDFPKLTWYQYTGIAFFVHCFVHSYITDIKDEYRNKYEKSIITILSPWLLLLGAWMFLFIYK